jgi:hypothetical protein
MGKKNTDTNIVLPLPGRIMIIRHAEKPGIYSDKQVIYDGIGEVGNADKESLVTLGWERAGGVAALFSTTANGEVDNALLQQPTVIYASDPIESKEPSQRPFQTISALASKLNVQPNITVKGEDFAAMVTDVLTKNKTTDVVLICWQHQDILKKDTAADSIVDEIVHQTKSALKNLPAKPWPGDRYDMVLVFDEVENGKYTRFSQVPQLLLAGDQKTLFK